MVVVDNGRVASSQRPPKGLAIDRYITLHHKNFHVSRSSRPAAMAKGAPPKYGMKLELAGAMQFCVLAEDNASSYALAKQGFTVMGRHVGRYKKMAVERQASLSHLRQLSTNQLKAHLSED